MTRTEPGELREALVVVVRIQPVAPPTRPSVTVIVPCYEYGRFLADSVGSALTQTDVDVDVLIIDNASSDDSPEIAKSLAAEDNRVECILHTTNQGHIASFNEGLSSARGEYVVLLCADDVLAPGSLRRSTALLDACPEVAFVYGHAPHFDDAPPTRRTEVRSWSVWSGPEWTNRICHNGHSVVTSPEAVVRSSAAGDVRYDAESGHAADFKYWLNCARRGCVGRVNGPDQGYYRVHGANLHLNTYGGWFDDLESRATAFERFFAEIYDDDQDCGRSEGIGREFSGLRSLHDEWRRTLAAEALDEACRSYERGRVVAVDVHNLEQFAVSTYPAARQLPQWHRLSRRKAIGARCAPYVPPFFASAVRRRVNEEIRRRRWVRTGMYERTGRHAGD